jgi:hypothetical protein
MSNDERSYRDAERRSKQLISGPRRSNSPLQVTDVANEITPEFEAAQGTYDEGGSVPYKLRSQRQVEQFFAGLELLDPGIVPVPQWRPEVTPITPPPGVQPLAGIGRKA